MTITVVGADDAYYEVGDYANTDGEVPYDVELSDFLSDDAAFAGITLSTSTCALYNLDDEAGGFTTQDDAAPTGKIFASVDEFGLSATADIEVTQSPTDDVYVPIYVKSGLVTLSSTSVVPDRGPQRVARHRRQHELPALHGGRTTGTTQSFTYAGVDDNDAAPSGESAFNIAIGPTFSNDANFNKKNDLVRGSVIDNDVLYRSRKSCNTTEGDRLRRPRRRQGQPHDVLQLDHHVPRRARVRRQVLQGLGRRARVVGDRVRPHRDREHRRGDLPTLRGFVERCRRDERWHGAGSTATFTAGGTVLLQINGTDDDMDDGDITYKVKLATVVTYDTGTDTGTMETGTFYLNVTNEDDDTAGLRVRQLSLDTGAGLFDRTYYKAAKRDYNDVDYDLYGIGAPPASYKLTLPHNVTKEASDQNVSVHGRARDAADRRRRLGVARRALAAPARRRRPLRGLRAGMLGGTYRVMSDSGSEITSGRATRSMDERRALVCRDDDCGAQTEVSCAGSTTSTMTTTRAIPSP